MKCNIPGPNVKVLGRTVHALARFGDELYLESLPDYITLRTLNAAESAYAVVKLKKSFFSYFKHNYYSTEDDESLKCKISMKSALNTFKSPAHMDKQVDSLEIKLDPENCKLIFKLNCKYGIVKTHFISILDCKTMQVVYDKEASNRLTTCHRILLDAIGNFQNSDDQVTMEVTSQSLILRNYTDSGMNLTKIIRTQVNLKPAEFESYIIGEETTVTFTLKEFRALLAFAEALNLPLQVYFETTGRPIVFVAHNGVTFEANFVLATSKPDNEQSTQNKSVAERSKRKETTNIEGPVNKKPHLDSDISKCLDEDSHLFNFVDIPDENMLVENGNIHVRKSNKVDDDVMDCDNIPPSPTSKDVLRIIFKRCFESTFDPKTFQKVILAENSDSE